MTDRGFHGVFTILGMICVTLLSACASDTPYTPNASLAHDTHAFADSQATAIAPVPARWWRLYDDRVLDELVTRSLSANADLRTAYANLDAARSALTAAQRMRLPQTVAESSLGVDSPAGQPSAVNVPSSDYDIAATASWDIDLFGRLRAASVAAGADAAAQQAALDGVRVAVAADTTLAYIDYCGANASAAVAADLVRTQSQSVAVVEDQLAVGEVSPLELAQANNLLAAARASLPVFASARANALYRLAVLQGVTPAQARQWPWTCSHLPELRTRLPVADGQALLLRRPDIREAERRLAATAARVGVARADLYPKINLGGAVGLLSGGLVSTLTPLVSWNFANQSVARARINQAQASASASLAQWDATVLNALAEVETGLADYQAQRLQLDHLDDALAQARLYAKRAAARVRIGDAGFLIQYDAERVQADAALQQVQSRLAMARAQVQLFRALGGGWQDAPAPQLPASTPRPVK